MGQRQAGRLQGAFCFHRAASHPSQRRPADSEGLPCAPPTAEADCLKSAVEPAGSRPARRPGFPSHCGTLLIAQGRLQQCHLAGRDSLLFVLSSFCFHLHVDKLTHPGELLSPVPAACMHSMASGWTPRKEHQGLALEHLPTHSKAAPPTQRHHQKGSQRR